MKKCSGLLICCLVLLFAFRAEAQVKDKDTLVQRIYRAVKNTDEQAFVQLFPNYTQIRAILDNMLEKVKDSSARAMMAQSFLQLNETVYKTKMLTEITSSFQKLIKQGTDKGITWSDLAFTGSNMEEESMEDFGGKQLKGVIHLKDAKQEYDLHFSETIWSEPEKAWFGAILRGIVKKGEPLASLDDYSGMDSTVTVDEVITATDSIAPPPPPPPPKPANKKPAEKKPVKTTKSAAIKPKN
jgi:hypothetical protein